MFHPPFNFQKFPKILIFRKLFSKFQNNNFQKYQENNFQKKTQKFKIMFKNRVENCLVKNKVIFYKLQRLAKSLVNFYYYYDNSRQYY